MEKQYYYDLPPSFRPDLLRRLSLKEFMFLVDQFGLEALAERLGYDEFLQYIREKTGTNGVEENGSINTRATENSQK